MRRPPRTDEADGLQQLIKLDANENPYGDLNRYPDPKPNLDAYFDLNPNTYWNPLPNPTPNPNRNPIPNPIPDLNPNPSVDEDTRDSKSTGL